MISDLLSYSPKRVKSWVFIRESQIPLVKKLMSNLKLLQNMHKKLMMMITGCTTLSSSQVTFFFLLWTESIHVGIKKPSGPPGSDIFKILKHLHFYPPISLVWLKTIGRPNFFAGRCKTWVGPILTCNDTEVFHLVIITLATVANLRSLDLSLIINLNVDRLKLQSLFYPYLAFWY